jgi:xanthine dehydrogenase FAD-binding subunit
MTNVFLPRTLDECWSILDAEPDARPYAGGTDLLVQMRAGELNPPALVCLERIPEIRGVREQSGWLWLGAGTTHAELMNERVIRNDLPILFHALRTLGSPLIRNMGTIGGNICTASPAADTLPPLYVLDAQLELQTRGARRQMALREFITGPGQTRLAEKEILTGILIDRPEGFKIQHFEKIGQRRAMACSIASMAALLHVSSQGRIEAARLAWGSVGPTVVTSGETEAALVGKKLSGAVFEKAAVLARKAVSPIDDIRATAAYRRQVAGNLLLRLTAHANGFANA